MAYSPLGLAEPTCFKEKGQVLNLPLLKIRIFRNDYTGTQSVRSPRTQPTAPARFGCEGRAPYRTGTQQPASPLGKGGKYLHRHGG